VIEFFGTRCFDVPADTQVEGEPRANLEIVLEITGEVAPAEISDARNIAVAIVVERADDEPADLIDKTRDTPCVGSDLAGERVGARCEAYEIVGVKLDAPMLDAGLDGVAAPDPGQIAADAEIHVERTPVKATGGVEAAIENGRKALAGDGGQQAQFPAPVPG